MQCVPHPSPVITELTELSVTESKKRGPAAAGPLCPTCQPARSVHSLISSTPLVVQSGQIRDYGVPAQAWAETYVGAAVGLVSQSVSYTHLRAHETGRNLVCRL